MTAHFRSLISEFEYTFLEQNPHHPLHILINHSTQFIPQPVVEQAHLERFQKWCTVFTDYSSKMLIHHPHLLSDTAKEFKTDCALILQIEKLRLHPLFESPLDPLPLSKLRAFHADLSDHVALSLQRIHACPKDKKLLQTHRLHLQHLKVLKSLLCSLSLSPFYSSALLEDLSVFNHPFELPSSEGMYLFGALHIFKFLNSSI